MDKLPNIKEAVEVLNAHKYRGYKWKAEGEKAVGYGPMKLRTMELSETEAAAVILYFCKKERKRQ